MKLLLLLVPIVDVPLQVRLGAETLAAISVRAFVIFAVISLVMSGSQLAMLLKEQKARAYFSLCG